MRSMKIVGLGILAVLAMAVSASAASAVEFVAKPSNAEEAFPLPVMDEGGPQTFTTASGTITCERELSEGEALKEKEPTTEEMVTYEGKCTANGLAKVSEPILATYRFHASGLVDVVSPITFKVEKTFLTKECTVTVPAQENLEKVTYDPNYNPLTKEEEPGVLGVLANVSGILSEGNGGPCGEGLTEGSYEGNAVALLTNGGTITVE